MKAKSKVNIHIEGQTHDEITGRLMDLISEINQREGFEAYYWGDIEFKQE